jgi:hypothetical protein
MKAILIFIVSLISIIHTSFGANIYSLKEAIARKLVVITISGIGPQNNKSSHFGDCLEASIRNVSSIPLHIELESGTLLPSFDSTYQTMLVTKSVKCEIGPKKTVVQHLFAMCSQMEKKSPAKNTRFLVGEMAENKLAKLAKLIEEKNLQNVKGQHAVWAVTNGLMLTSKNYTTDAEKGVLRYVQRNTLQKQKSEVQETIKITFQTHFHHAGNISVKIVDAKGNHYKTLISNKPIQAGKQSLDFWLSDIDFESGRYQAILFFDGIAVLEDHFYFK